MLTTHREGREWRRFSIMDAVWVKLLKELREFGMSREQLKTTKQSLEFESAKCGVAMPLLEFYTAFAIATKMPVLVLVLSAPDGESQSTPSKFLSGSQGNHSCVIHHHGSFQFQSQAALLERGDSQFHWNFLHEHEDTWILSMGRSWQNPTMI